MAHYARQVEIDFGPIPVTQANFTIVDAAVTPDAVLSGAVAYEPPIGKALDELSMDSLSLRLGAGAGVVNVNVNSLAGPVSGTFRINYSINGYLKP